jgi:hypothetical protein
MGKIPDLRLLEVLNQLRADPDARVRWLVLKSLSSFNRAGVKPKQVAEPSEPLGIPSVEELPAFEPPAPEVAEPSGTVFTTRTFGRLL